MASENDICPEVLALTSNPLIRSLNYVKNIKIASEPVRLISSYKAVSFYYCLKSKIPKTT